MPTDAERWRFLADHGLMLHMDTGDYGYMIRWVRTGSPGQPPSFWPVSNGRTADEAIDRAIDRYNRKQGLPGVQATSQNIQEPEARLGVRRLSVRGWVS